MNRCNRSFPGEPHLMSVMWRALDKIPWKLWGPLMRMRWRSTDAAAFRKRNVGGNSYVDPSVQIFGWQNVTVGKCTAVSEDVWLNAACAARSTTGSSLATSATSAGAITFRPEA